MQFLYKKSILGGTFDHFHLGHQKLIDTAFEQSEHVTIGLTKPTMYQNKFLPNTIEDYDIRETSLKKYLKKKDFETRAIIIPINNIYGTTLQNKTIEAIFATEENLYNVNLINIKRKEVNFPELKTVIVTYVKDSNGENITSERIRKGEIDRSGLVYKNIFNEKETLILPDNLRPILQKPFGKVVKTTKEVISLLDEKMIVIAVGDIIASRLKEVGFNPAVSIIDFKTRRHNFTSQFLNTKLNHSTNGRIVNKQGTITEEAVDEFKKAMDKYLKIYKSQTVIIDGEEDLLALPAILFSPLNSIVLYGQFDQGIVVNNVTEELKIKALGILKKFN